MVLPAIKRIRDAFLSLHNQIAGTVFDLGAGTRTADAFRQVLQGIGRNIRILAQRG